MDRLKNLILQADYPLKRKLWPTIAKAVLLCLLGQQRSLTIAWGRDHGRDVLATSEVSLFP
eukprot:10784191-Alexandrium_andersonii.AAC.1